MYKRDVNKDGSRSKSNSYLFSARLNANKRLENEAIKAIQYYLDNEGYTPRQLLTDMILNMDGRTPEMFDGDDDMPITKSSMRNILQDELSNLLPELVNIITSMIRDGSITTDDIQNIQSDDNDTSEFESNLISGVLARRKQKGK